MRVRIRRFQKVNKAPKRNEGRTSGSSLVEAPAEGSDPSRSERSKQNAHVVNSHLGMVTITHPFHPLQGQSFALLNIKEMDGLRRYSLQTDTGVVCVPETWINRC
jgi:hypothetical protein